MTRLLLVVFLLGGLFFSCEYQDSIGEVDKLSPQELADLALADPDVVRTFALQQEINNQRSLAILDGATMPDGPGIAILGSSTSPSELAVYLRDYNFPDASAKQLGALYAERNQLLPKFEMKYKPYHDQLSEAELVELGKLLPDTRAKVSAAAALEKLENK